MSKVMDRPRKVEKRVQPVSAKDQTCQRRIDLMMSTAFLLSQNVPDPDLERHFPKVIRKAANTFRHGGGLTVSTQTAVTSAIRTFYINNKTTPIPPVECPIEESDLFEELNKSGIEEFIQEFGEFRFEYEGEKYTIIGKRAEDVFEADVFVLPVDEMELEIFLQPCWRGVPGDCDFALVSLLPMSSTLVRSDTVSVIVLKVEEPQFELVLA